MNQRSLSALCSLLALASFASARTVSGPGCGTHRDKAAEEIFLHQQSERKLISGRATPRGLHQKAVADAARNSNRDYGDIAVIDDSEGVVARPNTFDLDQKTIRFAPVSSTTRYRVSVTNGSYDSSAVPAGQKLAALGDDDTSSVPLPFAFPFFGTLYRSVYVNSDGNLSFGTGDAGSTDRSLGRVTSGPPRIAPLFDDLDPTSATADGGVYVTAEAGRVVISWSSVPEYSQFGAGTLETFQVRLYPDGAIEFAYGGTAANEAVVGIAPGTLKGTTNLVSFTSGPAGEFASAVLERFASSDAVDIVTAAQKFYATHDDAYDYLVIYNNQGIASAPNAVAYEVTVRNDRSGYGDQAIAIGDQFGSTRRLQSVINMGSTDQYPLDPLAWVPARGSTHDTPLSIIAHETGHLFLAFASVKDADSPTSQPMLNPRNLVHWAFTFNSEASLLEGNRIQDQGEGTDPRFKTTATVEGYSPLDQYLMGFRSADEVPPTFYAAKATIRGDKLPQANVSFNGERRNVQMDELISVVGRRTPDSTVAQRNFRFAFILVVPAGQDPSAADLAQVDKYRSEFEGFYASAASNRATADTKLASAVQFSGAPATGLIAGRVGTGSISIATPASAPVEFTLQTATGATSVPGSVTIPAGQTQATFLMTGVREGVEELTILPASSAYETVHARVQVLGGRDRLSLAVVSGDRQAALGGPLGQPVVLRVTDVNNVPYSNVPVAASVSAGGTLDVATAVSDDNGLVSFHWTPGANGSNELTARVDGSDAVARVAAFGRPAFAAAGIVNAASFAAGVAPGAIAALFGSNLTAGVTRAAVADPLPASLAGVQVLVNGAPAPLFYVSDTQINFVVPAGVSGKSVNIVVSNPAAQSDALTLSLTPVQPGVFFDAATKIAAALISGTRQTTAAQQAQSGDVLEIYCTGLGALEPGADGLSTTVSSVQVSLGGVPAEVMFSGAAPGFAGLYQVNVRVPSGVTAGPANLIITAAGATSNTTLVLMR